MTLLLSNGATAEHFGGRVVALRFNPRQPRDSHGRWTSRGGISLPIKSNGVPDFEQYEPGKPSMTPWKQHPDGSRSVSATRVGAKRNALMKEFFKENPDKDPRKIWKKRLEESKPKRGSSEEDRFIGTSLQGETKANARTIAKRFGAPKSITDDDKGDGQEWHIDTPHGPGTIYKYKGRPGRSIGGNNKKTAQWIEAELNAARSKPISPKPRRR